MTVPSFSKYRKSPGDVGVGLWKYSTCTVTWTEPVFVVSSLKESSLHVNTSLRPSLCVESHWQASVVKNSSLLKWPWISHCVIDCRGCIRCIQTVNRLVKYLDMPAASAWKVKSIIEWRRSQPSRQLCACTAIMDIVFRFIYLAGKFKLMRAPWALCVRRPFKLVQIPFSGFPTKRGFNGRQHSLALSTFSKKMLSQY